MQLTGAVMGLGQEPKRLFMNRGTRFEDVAKAVGIANPYGRARMPLWVDLNRDGRLDLFEGAEVRLDDRTPAFTFLRQGELFVEDAGTLRFASRSPVFCIVSELNNDAHLDLVCKVEGRNVASQIFDIFNLPAQEHRLLPSTAFEDVAAGDFDNDGWIDLFLARKNPPGPVAIGRHGDAEIVADVWIDEANLDKPLGFSFRSTGTVNFRIASAYSPEDLAPNHIHVGAQGSHPEGLSFSVSPETAGVAGTKPYRPGAQAGIYVGLTGADRWQVFVSGTHDRASGGKSKFQQATFSVTSSTPISEVVASGEPATAEEAVQRLFMNRAGRLIEEGDRRGVNRRAVAAINVVAGDFNNDMLLDLFVLASGDIGERENLLLLNRGSGYFDLVSMAGGAADPRSRGGRFRDDRRFRRDGCLDLLVATGGSMGRSLGMPSAHGGYRLYRNLCDNGNHWLEIDLEGTVSNRDGIGARVRVTAGGVTQTRIQDGGVHNRGQNHSRLHFGLAHNARVEKIGIQWPNGTMQELRGIGADQVLRIKEEPAQ